MTPNTLEILLHYHVSPVTHPRIQAPAVQESIQFLLDNKMLTLSNRVPGESSYNTTDRGKAWLQSILDTPMPKQAWLDKDGVVIQF